MTKDELVKHLRTVHGSKIEYPGHYLKTILAEIHTDLHVKEREANNAFDFRPFRIK